MTLIHSSMTAMWFVSIFFLLFSKQTNSHSILFIYFIYLFLRYFCGWEQDQTFDVLINRAKKGGFFVHQGILDAINRYATYDTEEATERKGWKSGEIGIYLFIYSNRAFFSLHLTSSCFFSLHFTLTDDPFSFNVLLIFNDCYSLVLCGCVCFVDCIELRLPALTAKT
jgi:hypothetical protein